ncbi:MAG: hypothetical protein KAH35_09585 [Candidatus Atribacteria bacterium]|nr:hypothetical protein [Candidatus Atribacteria bacterium]
MPNDGMIYPTDRIEEGKKLDKLALSKGYFNYETIRKKKDGTVFPVLIIVSLMKYYQYKRCPSDNLENRIDFLYSI